jgi:hypothetical protein
LISCITCCFLNKKRQDTIIMICSQCSGNDFEKLSENIYRCKYCGTVRPLEKKKTDFTADKTGVPDTGVHRRQKKPLVIAALAGVVVAVTVLLYIVTMRGGSPSEEGTVSGEHQKIHQYGSEAFDMESEPKGDFTEVSVVPDSIGNIYFVGFYKNTGKSPIRKPRVTVFLLSKEGSRIASGRGYGLRQFLLPSEKTMVRVLVRKAPVYSSYEIQHEPKRPYSFNTRRPVLEFIGMKLARGRYSGYEVTGMCRNISEEKVKSIRVAAILKDGSKKIIGFGSGIVDAQYLNPGEESPFRVLIHTVTAKPASFFIDYSARYSKLRRAGHLLP